MSKYKTPQDIPGWDPKRIVDELKYSLIGELEIGKKSYELWFEELLEKHPEFKFNPPDDKISDYNYHADILLSVLLSFLKSDPTTFDVYCMASWLRKLAFDCERECVINRDDFNIQQWACMIEDGRFPREKALAKLTLLNKEFEELAPEIVSKKDENGAYGLELRKKILTIFAKELLSKTLL